MQFTVLSEELTELADSLRLAVQTFEVDGQTKAISDADGAESTAEETLNLITLYLQNKESHE